MRRYIRTHFIQASRKLLRAAAFLGLMLVCAGVAAQAQHGKKHSNNGQAVLHLRVVVVPVAMLPPQAIAARTRNSAITYNVPVNQLQMDVKEEVKLLSLASIVGSGQTGSAVLKTHTVEPQ